MDFEKKNNIYRMFMAIVVTAIITFIGTTILLYNYFFKTEEGLVKTLIKVENSSLETKINLIKKYIDESYLGEINEDDMSEMAVKGYVAGLGDMYTEYLTKDEYEELMVEVNGDYVGIGIYMAQDKYGNVVVLLPIEGSPAEEAGIQSGDIIVKVNGEDCLGMELSLIANKVKGEEGTTVELEIQREEEIIKKTVERKTVEIKDIESELLENDIGYIQILSFDDECSNKFKRDLEELKAKGIKSLIIDLRDNGGGIATEATDIADMLIEKNKNIMIEVDKNNNKIITTDKKDPIIDSEIKIFVLANENSASASEILIGALKDNDVAKIVGTKTFGKGVMQELVPVSTGGALKLTIKEFLTPNGNKINKEGIAPDIEVEDNEETETDEQLQKAIEMCK